MKKKHIFRIGIILIVIIGIIWLWKELTWTGRKYMGKLEHPCKKEYSLHMYKNNGFKDHIWIEFRIAKNDTIVTDYLEFENYGIGAKLKDLKINCYDDILYVNWHGSNIPTIIFDYRTGALHYNGYDNYKKNKGNDLDSIKTALYNRIKKGNPHLRWGGELTILNQINPCNKDFSIILSYYSSSKESPVTFNLMKKDSIIDSYPIDMMYNEEKPVKFEGFCYDNIFYITIKNKNIPLIMFDSKNNLLSYKSQGSEFHPNYMNLFNRLKAGNPKLEID